MISKAQDAKINSLEEGTIIFVKNYGLMLKVKAVTQKFKTDGGKKVKFYMIEVCTLKSGVPLASPFIYPNASCDFDIVQKAESKKAQQSDAGGALGVKALNKQDEAEEEVTADEESKLGEANHEVATAAGVADDAIVSEDTAAKKIDDADAGAAALSELKKKSEEEVAVVGDAAGVQCNQNQEDAAVVAGVGDDAMVSVDIAKKVDDGALPENKKDDNGSAAADQDQADEVTPSQLMNELNKGTDVPFRLLAEAPPVGYPHVCGKGDVHGCMKVKSTWVCGIFMCLNKRQLLKRDCKLPILFTYKGGELKLSPDMYESGYGSDYVMFTTEAEPAPEDCCTYCGNLAFTPCAVPGCKRVNHGGCITDPEKLDEEKGTANCVGCSVGSSVVSFEC